MIEVPQSTVTPVHTFSELLLDVNSKCTNIASQVLVVVVLMVNKVNFIQNAVLSTDRKYTDRVTLTTHDVSTVPMSTRLALDLRWPSCDTCGALTALLPMLAGARTLALNAVVLDATMLAPRRWLAALVALLARLQRKPMSIDLVAIESATRTALGTFD